MPNLHDIWYSRSTNMKVVTVAMVTAVLVHALSMATDHWVEWQGGQHAGLFTYLLVDDIRAPPGAIPAVYLAMSIVSFLTLLCDTVLNISWLHRRYYLVTPALFVFAFVAGLMYAVTIILWCFSHLRAECSPSWSFGLAVSVVALDSLVTVLSLIEFLVKWRDAPPLFAEINTLQPSEGREESPEEDSTTVVQLLQENETREGSTSRQDIELKRHCIKDEDLNGSNQEDEAML